LEVSEAAKKVIAEAGYDPIFGARPLRRAIQHLVEDPLAEKLLAGTFETGATIWVDAVDGSLTFEVKAAVPSDAGTPSEAK
jgi:ATP-dependent Clp protease ATP-binding subunit ClpA